MCVSLKALMCTGGMLVAAEAEDLLDSLKLELHSCEHLHTDALHC